MIRVLQLLPRYLYYAGASVDVEAKGPAIGRQASMLEDSDHMMVRLELSTLA